MKPCQLIGRNQRTKTYKQLPLDGPRGVLSASILKKRPYDNLIQPIYECISKGLINLDIKPCQ